MRERIGQLCADHALPDAAADRFASLLSLLAADEHAPTAVTDPALAVDVHLADSLSALGLSCVRSAREIVDIGAGAGFPGLPLAVALPQAHVSLLESSTRKCRFLSTAVDRLALPEASVVCARAEAWPEGRARHDLAVARALSSQPVVIEYAAPLLRLGGTLVEWRGERDPAAERAASSAALELGMEPGAVERVVPFPHARSHHLHLFVKVTETPPGFPRRPGLASKRPLGAVSSPAASR